MWVHQLNFVSLHIVIKYNEHFKPRLLVNEGKSFLSKDDKDV